MATPLTPDAVRATLPRKHAVVGIATVADGAVERRTWNSEVDADFELGSVSKALTGMLYADALARGEVSSDTTLGDVLPLADTNIGSATLGSLATHSSGLPRLAPTPPPRTLWNRQWAYLRRGANPYGDSLEEFLEQVKPLEVGRREPLYSNIGFALLGHAVAAAAGATYAQVLEERLSRPLGLSLYVASTPQDLREQAIAGRSPRGRVQEPWTGEAIAPAGGIRGCIEDVARLLAALVDGTAPGAAAMEPTAFLGRGTRVGAGWLTIDTPKGPLTVHNGQTGGFASWVGIDRAQGRALAILTATPRTVDRQGLAALGG